MELYYLYIVIYILLTKLYYVLNNTIYNYKCNKCTVPSLQSVAIRVSPLAIFMNIWAHFCETSTSATKKKQIKIHGNLKKKMTCM